MFCTEGKALQAPGSLWRMEGLVPMAPGGLRFVKSLKGHWAEVSSGSLQVVRGQLAAVLGDVSDDNVVAYTDQLFDLADCCLSTTEVTYEGVVTYP